jgi:hypothetical protein
MPAGLRNIRVPDDLWSTAKVVAARRNETVTDAIIRFLVAYTGAKPIAPDQLG